MCFGVHIDFLIQDQCALERNLIQMHVMYKSDTSFFWHRLYRLYVINGEYSLIAARASAQFDLSATLSANLKDKVSLTYQKTM